MPRRLGKSYPALLCVGAIALPQEAMFTKNDMAMLRPADIVTVTEAMGLCTPSSRAKHCHDISCKRRFVGQCCRPYNAARQDTTFPSSRARPSVAVCGRGCAAVAGNPTGIPGDC